MPKPTVKQLRLAGPESEISVDFLQGMVDRMMVSFHKYGAVAEATEIDNMSSAWQRQAKYHQTGNTEWLMDAANFLMMEFMANPDAFHATDSESEPVGRIKVTGAHTDGRNGE